MRYDNWDVLLFPTGPESKTPFKEFRVGCNVIPDVELSQCHGSVGVPVMTCFVPSLEAGAHFQLSVHSWTGPEISQFTKSYSKHVELVQFEARIFMDGQLVASAVFDRKEEWPHLINSTCEVTKSGELAPLKFPSFRKEVLNTSHWNPGDDTGRIKVVISEGFPRDSPTLPTERVKNIVAFSFQHAPLEILESIGVAWPNPSMWRLPSLMSSQLPVPTYHPDDGSQTHAHSPRHRSFLRRPPGMFPPSNMMMGPAQGQCNPFFGSPGFPIGLPTATRFPTGFGSSDALENMAYIDWMNPLAGGCSSDRNGVPMWSSMRDPNRMSTSDETASLGDTMPEFAYQFQNDRRQTFGGAEPMHLSGPSLEDEPLPAMNLHLKVPTNTPTTGFTMGSSFDTVPTTAPTATFPFGGPSSGTNSHSYMTPDFAHSLTHSLLNQPLPLPLPVSAQPQNIPLPASEVKSRKENRLLNRYASNPDSASSTLVTDHMDTRKFSQQLFNGTPTTGSSIMFDPTTSSHSQRASPSSTSPTSTGTVFSSQVVSRAGSGGDLGTALGNLRTGGSTPMPLRNTSAGALNAGGLGVSGRKRNREFTPASSKVIDDEDQPLRPSPHMRAAGFGLGNDENE